MTQMMNAQREGGRMLTEAEERQMVRLLQKLYELVKGHDAQVAVTAALNFAAMAACSFDNLEKVFYGMGVLMREAVKLNAGKNPMHVALDEGMWPYPKNDHVTDLAAQRDRSRLNQHEPR